MNRTQGVKTGDIRGKYNSKYKTEEEKLNARKERQKQYYYRKKHGKNSPVVVKTEEEILKETLSAKEKEIKLLTKKLLDSEKQVAALKHENKILSDKLEICVSNKESLARSISPIKEDSETFDETSDEFFSNSEDSPIVEKRYTEDEIRKYAQERKRSEKSKKIFKYDIHIEKIIADRNREITD